MSRSSTLRAEETLRRLAELYNAALQERRDHWKVKGESVGFYTQSKQLPGIKQARPEYAAIDAQVLEGCLKRLHLAFEAFFRRVKSGENPGYPRFRASSRYDSMTFRQTGWRLDGKRLTLRGIGTLKLFLSRPVEGTIKAVILRRDSCGDWLVTFQCDGVPAAIQPATGQAIGIDVGLASFLTTSEGEAIANPRHFREGQRALKVAQRRVARRKRGSGRQRQARRAVARHHRKVQRQRRDFHFKTAHSLVQRYDLIAVEALNVSGLARSRLAKSVHDAGWGQFIEILTGKAEKAGRQIVAVDPKGTSQRCSGCGSHVPKPLSQRVHACSSCGLTLDRDVNAALNILARAAPSASDTGSQRVA